jgi:hypothetical protein
MRQWRSLNAHPLLIRSAPFTGESLASGAHFLESMGLRRQLHTTQKVFAAPTRHQTHTHHQIHLQQSRTADPETRATLVSSVVPRESKRGILGPISALSRAVIFKAHPSQTASSAIGIPLKGNEKEHKKSLFATTKRASMKEGAPQTGHHRESRHQGRTPR